ncbi:MAG TPA: protein kinase [Pyrinomonadaceae bacterium]|nr:protein kinase [Pyrinomonadaceae bacterium]
MLDNFYYARNVNPISRYQFKEKLGAGAYGIVHRAVNSETKVTVAIKQPSQTSGDVFKRFSNEIKFYNRMSDSPFILRMLDFNDNPFLPFLATEFCDLGNARSRLWELRINRTRTIALLWQAASALAVAHSRKILHRDIKPDNLLLKTDSQNNWILKLGDPGLACFPARSILDFGATRTAKGTEFYIAPELYQRGAVYTNAADVFSFGVTAHEMLSGERILAGSTVNAFRSELNELLSQMVSSDPKARPQMRFVKNKLAEIYQNEIRIAQDWRFMGGAILLFGIIGLGSYYILKEFE